jgi:hypothetical protein
MGAQSGLSPPDVNAQNAGAIQSGAKDGSFQVDVSHQSA